MRGWYLTLTPPPGTPPNWVFAPVWTVLYVLMGVAAWLVWLVPAAMAQVRRQALRAWGWQLGVNALWTPAFFGLHDPALGLLVLAVLLVLIGRAIRLFAALRPMAALLLMPYLAWSCYALWLNLGFWWLNRA